MPGNNLWLTSVIALLAMLNEFAGVLAGNISGTRRYDGPMGKSDRALMIGFFCLIYFFSLPFPDGSFTCSAPWAYY